ncbi:MAG: hypothetical protein R3Y56_03990 [Akkermansia sp.]
MKSLYLLTLVSALALVSCSLPVETAPPNTRAVVGPEGSSKQQKSWNTVTKGEGDAVLGAFGGMNGQ